MSSLEVSSYDYDDDYYDPREIWEENHASLRRDCENSVASVTASCSDLPEEFRADVAHDLQTLVKTVSALVQQYTYEAFSVSDRLSDHRTTLNQHVAQIRQKIAALKIEQEETARRVSACLTASRGILSDAFTTKVLSTYEAEVEQIRAQIKKAERTSSLRQKDKILAGLVETLQKLADLHGFAKTVDLSGFQEEKAKITANNTQKGKRILKLRRDIEEYARLVKDIDEDTFRKLQSLIESSRDITYEQRLNATRDQVKLTYGKIKEKIKATHIYKDMLKDLQAQATHIDHTGDVVRQMDRLMAKKIIEKKEFDTLSAKVNTLISKENEARRKMKRNKAFVSKVRENLMKLNYAVIYEKDEHETTQKMERGETVYFDTRWDGYKIMSKINERGELVTRMIKAVATEEEKKNRTAHQRQRDMEIAKNWCKDYDFFMEQMLHDGIRLNVTVRREPEEEEVLYIVNKEMARSRKKESAKAGKSEALKRTI